MVPRVLVTYCFCVGKANWKSDMFSHVQPKCFDSTAPTPTVNFVRLDEDDLPKHSTHDPKSHYDPSRHGGTSRENVIWPFYYSLMYHQLTHPATSPRSGMWDDSESEPPWSLERSKLFSGRKKENPLQTFWDTDALLLLAFNTDWVGIRAKLTKMKVTDADVELLGDSVMRHIRQIYILFKRNVVLNRSSSMNMTMLSFEHCLTFCNISDDGVVKKRDIDRVFISTTADKENRMSGLERGEFVEALLRIARLKYMETRKTNSIVEAFGMLYHDHLGRHNLPSSDEFRKLNLYSWETESVLAAHIQNFRTIFNHYCATSNTFGRCMTLAEFHSFVDDTQLTKSRKITHDEAAVCFAMSKFTSIDESKNDHHTTLTFNDFVESICRMSFQLDANRKLSAEKSRSSIVSVIQTVRKMQQAKNHLIDNQMKSIYVGLREAVPAFKRHLQIVFADNDHVQSECANVIKNWLRRRIKVKNIARKKLAEAQNSVNT